MTRPTEPFRIDSTPPEYIQDKNARIEVTRLPGSSSEGSDVEKFHNRAGPPLETPKVALSRWPKLGTCIVHFVGLAVTFVLFYLNFKPVYWFDVDGFDGSYIPSGIITAWIETYVNIPYNAFLKALLLAGKAHEIALVGSLAAVVLHVTRKKLVTGPGLPLGMLSASNRQLGYFISREFRQTMLFEKRLALFLVASAVIGVLLGPASNALMQPSLAWWSVVDPFAGNDLPVYVGATRALLWPNFISADYIPSYYNCSTYDAQSAPFECPNAGFSAIYQMVQEDSQTGNAATLAFSDPLSSQFRTMSYASGAPSASQGTPNGITFLSTPTAIMARMIELFATFIQEDLFGVARRIVRPRFTVDLNTPIYSPLVTSSCNVYDYETAVNSIAGDGNQPVFPFPNSVVFNSTSTYTSANALAVPTEFWNFTRALNTTNFTWVDTWTLGQANSSRTSIGGLWTIPYEIQGTNGTTTQHSLLAPCSIDARWVNYELQDDFIAGLLTSNITSPASYQKSDTQGTISNMLQIDPNWADQLNAQTMAFTDNTLSNRANMSAMVALARAFIIIDPATNAPYLSVIGTDFFSYGTSIAPILADGIGMIVTDGLARIEADRNIAVLIGPDTTDPKAMVNVTGLVHQVGASSFDYNATVGNWTMSALDPPDTWTRLTFTVERMGYGWGPTNIVSLLAMALLASHALIILSFLFYGVVWAPWCTSAWNDVADFLVLAHNSAPNHFLDGTCAGVDSPQVLQSRVGIREMPAGSNHLELVLSPGSGYELPGGLPLPRKLYG